jgi:predicted GNAT family acetyltransferase
VEFTDDVESYADAVTAFLDRDPVRCTVLLTVIANARLGLTDMFTGSWVTGADGSVVGVASWTPPYDLLLSPMSVDAAQTVADAWAGKFGTDLTGVVGPREVIEPCVQRLIERTGREPRERFAERLFRLDAVIDPPAPAGSARRADSRDADLAVKWFVAFIDETGVIRGRDVERDVLARIADGRLTLWVIDGRPVALVANGVSAAGVTRIGPVYTPPEERGHGFARALVAAVSRERLDAGDLACCLFTDLANPVSNAIYQQVGYRPVGDYAQVELIAT